MTVAHVGALQTMYVFRDICEARSLPHTSHDSGGGDVIAVARVHRGVVVAPHRLQGIWLAQPNIECLCDFGGVTVLGDGRKDMPIGPHPRYNARRGICRHEKKGPRPRFGLVISMRRSSFLDARSLGPKAHRSLPS